MFSLISAQKQQNSKNDSLALELPRLRQGRPGRVLGLRALALRGLGLGLHVADSALELGIVLPLSLGVFNKFGDLLLELSELLACALFCG